MVTDGPRFGIRNYGGDCDSDAHQGIAWLMRFMDAISFINWKNIYLKFQEISEIFVFHKL